MNNKVERELVRLYNKLSEKYDFKMMRTMYNSGSIDTVYTALSNDDIREALSYWFDVRIRKLDPAQCAIPKSVSSNTIVNEIYNDLGITVPHRVVASFMSIIVSEDDMLYSHDIVVPFDTVFSFDNVELVELSELATLKIFIAQPMSGVPDEEVEEIREKVTKLMKNKYGDDIEIIDQFHVPEEEMAKEPLERPGIHLLGRSIQFLADADLVVFVGDFLHAKGCCVELAVCKEYSIPFEILIYEKEDQYNGKSDMDVR